MHGAGGALPEARPMHAGLGAATAGQGRACGVKCEERVGEWGRCLANAEKAGGAVESPPSPRGQETASLLTQQAARQHDEHPEQQSSKAKHYLSCLFNWESTDIPSLAGPP